MRKQLLMVTAGLAIATTTSAQLKVGSNPTTLATDALFQVEADNASQFFINKTNGKVGIGTITPTASLHSYSEIGTSSIYSQTADETNLARITSAIGTRALSMFYHGNSRTITRWGLPSISDFGELLVEGNSNGLVIGTTANKPIIFGTGSLSGSTTNSNTRERMRISADGNVGIGTSAPLVENYDKSLNIHSLDVGGTGNGSVIMLTRINTDALFRGAGIAHKYNLSLGKDVLGFFASSSNNGFPDTFSEYDMILVAGATPGNGKVGIGTTDPKSKLHVVGLVEYADNAAAVAGGLTEGAFYRTGDLLKVVH